MGSPSPRQIATVCSLEGLKAGITGRERQRKRARLRRGGVEQAVEGQVEECIEEGLGLQLARDAEGSADDEAWLLSDADDRDLEAAGYGAAIDSRRYGPVPVSSLVGRVWFRYGPLRRIGRPASAPSDLLARGRTSAIPTT